MIKLWREIKSSEMRIGMMQELRTLGVGFNDVEEFNFGLMYHFKSQKMKDEPEPDNKVVRAAMEVKMNDERSYYKELCSERNTMRRKLTKTYENNSKPYRRIMKFLRSESAKEGEMHESKYKEKIQHLKNKYRESMDDKVNKIPTGMEAFASLSIFNQEKFDKIKKETYKVTTLGDIEIDDDEECVMRLPPKFGILERLTREDFAFQQELCYTKIRMKIGQEIREEMQGELSQDQLASKEKSEEQDAKSRMIYDPENLTYNDHNRRVTDMDECSRVTLPKPLPIQEEAKIEIRREMHSKIFNDYVKEFCNERGEQKSNLREEEQKGIKKLQKRVQEGKGVVMKTDKSGKMCICTREKYLELGMQHVAGDRVINREELRDIERHLNGHGMAWSKIWGTGKAHNHEDRVMSSRNSCSENTSDLLVAFKDHKKEEKGRPIATGNSGNTRALSNAVSDYVEAVATSEKNKIEVISSEDMLHSYKNHDKKVKELKEDIQRRKHEKMRCTTCCPGEIRCLRCSRQDSHPARPETTIHPEVSPTPGSRQDTNIHPGSCDQCIIKVLEKLKETCTECGPGISDEEQQICHIAVDVVALFPSITSERTGRIVRERSMKSDMKIVEFDWMEGARYIAISPHLTGPLGKLKRLIPVKRKVGGVKPGITSKDVNKKKSSIEVQWYFPTKIASKEQIREIASRCAEIAVRTLFEKFTYNFGGKTYLQSKGGPIGARITMACARLVMQDWGEKFTDILLHADLKLTLFKSYVDDGRLAGTVLKLGMRYCNIKKSFKYAASDEMIDKILEEGGETIDARMARVCLPAMEDINPDLKFTPEVASDFPDGWVPTLDFKTKMLEDGTITHTYFQKSIKTPYVLVQRSAMSQKQKYNILANEMIRRLSNGDKEGTSQDEKNRVVEELTKEMKSSGWERNETREVIVSGILGWERKHERRKNEKTDFYRSAASTLSKRCRKKLTEKTSWYKGKDDEEESETEKQPSFTSFSQKTTTTK